MPLMNLLRDLFVSDDNRLDEKLNEYNAMRQKLCSICGLFGCFHMREKYAMEGKASLATNKLPGFVDSNPRQVSSISLGEQVGNKPDAMESFSGIQKRPVSIENNKIRVDIGGEDTDIRSSLIEIPVEGKNTKIPVWPDNGIIASSNNKRLIPPPVPSKPSTGFPNISNYEKPETKSLIAVSANEHVDCNICRAKVLVDYLDSHLRIHCETYKPRVRGGNELCRAPISTRETSTSTALVKSDTKTTTTYSTVKHDKPSLSLREIFKFRKIEEACAASSMTVDGRYSDFTLILFMKERSVVSNYGYATANSYVSKDRERISIHCVYDSVEEYWTTTTKLLKRSSYSTVDDESTVPDRLIDQKDLSEEIGKALLFFCVSPRAAYKAFRKIIRKGEFVITYDKDRACIVQTSNSIALNDKLKKPESHWEKDDYYSGMYG